MPSDYKKICQDNIRRRGEEFDDIGHLIAEQLYSEKSHFIYELLQNAEDALERRCRQNSSVDSPGQVRFSLFPDRLEFRHFGELFNEEDVRGVSDVLKGTKGQDSKQIGKFGIGFKSVYAFTASPEIHSGEEHFTIKRYIRPEAKPPGSHVSIKPGETVFIFPFDHEDFSKSDAFNLILDKLRKLGPSVLLFLRRINEIEWSVEPDGEEGQYLKEAKNLNHSGTARRVTVIGQKNSQDENEDWLIFERPVTVPDSSGEVPVEVGFRVEKNTEDRVESVVKITNAPLVVYFPTEKATRLGFLVQGPYRTTPPRDNISKDDEWNKTLIKETAELIVDSLRQLKEMDLLSVSLLEALPIRPDDFQEGSMFYPIFSKVKEALLSEELLPADDGTFVAAQNAKLARGAELMRLLDQGQLQALFQSDEETKWLKGRITRDRFPDLRSYLVNELYVDEVTPDGFASHLSRGFLAKQSDDWFIRFYKFLLEQRALWRRPRRSWDTEGILRNKPILRLEDGAHITPFYSGSPSVYLATETDIGTSLPIVKITLSSDEGARKFLQELGVPELDIVEEVIEEILPKYADDSTTVDPEENERDLKKIERAYKMDSAEKKNRLRDALRKTPFILAECPNEGGKDYRKPHQVYFSREELQIYFSGNDSFACVNLDHPRANLFRELEVLDRLRIKCKSNPRSTADVYLGRDGGHHRRGLEGFDPDIYVDGLDNALRTPSVEKSQIIWNEIATNYRQCIKGIVLISSRQDFSLDAKVRERKKKTSSFGALLMSRVWLPDSDGHLHKPSELTLDDLPESFACDEKLADQLGMKKNVVAKLAEEAGISENVLHRAKQIEDASPEIQQQIDSLLQGESKKKTQQQESTPYVKALSETFSKHGKEKVNNSGVGGNGGFSPNPPRRREKISEEIEGGIEKERAPEERSFLAVRKKWNGKSDQVRADFVEWYSGQCQICKKTFTQQNGTPYFEGLYLVSRTAAEWIDRVGNVLCLCAEHSAKFQFGPKKVDEDIIQQVLRLKVQKEGGDGNPSIRMKLCGEPIEIKFAEKHLIDLQEMIKKSQELESDE